MMMKFGWFVMLALLVGSEVHAQQADEDFDPDMPPEMAMMQAGEGRETTFYMCSACHSMKLVTQQRLSRDRWDYLLDWMTKEQGMPPLDDEMRGEILDYLSTSYGPDQSSRKTQRR
ncbi:MULTISPECIES: hypothetical protein [unclassified Iodidimonas]|jgi:cytochrome c1|uniref:hypothetical protein n=1 Tax=unclassified Iodidimonas TaxID=2626145 RepID=UPI002482E571|nr:MULTISPECIES: hypothetical protein [unclassified Iodidimonas]